jgi:serine/threonine protein kinase/Flp pilus assembly protein TadD
VDRPGAEPVPGYRLLNRVGAGGAGEVWCAEAPGGLRVALKIVRLGGGLGRREMANIRILRAIRHPNLLAYFGAWQLDGRLVIGMELADRSLWDRFTEARSQGLAGIPLGELLDVVREVAKVIDFLNEPDHRLEGRSGVAIHHRDIKPQNIMLIGRGVKVADFGLSCLDDCAAASRSLCGLTFAYAAPETFRRQVTAGSDQYSLAVTFCQLRGGRLPFVGPPAAVMMGHLFHEPDLSVLPEPERPVVARAMAKQPSERWPDCRSFINALVECAEARSHDTLPGISAGPDDSVVPSRSLVVPPLSGEWQGSLSASSDDLKLTAGEADASAYCVGMPTPGDPSAPVSAASSTSPTVVVSDIAGRQPRRRVSRLVIAAVLILAPALVAWSWSARPTGRADVPSTPAMAVPVTTSRSFPPPPPPRISGRALRTARYVAAPEPTLATIRLPDASAWKPLIREASATAQTWLTHFRPIGGPGAISRPSPAQRTSSIPQSIASTQPAPQTRSAELHVGMPELLEVEAGRGLSVPIRVNRAGQSEALAVHFDGLPPGVSIPDVTIPAGQDRAEVAVRARVNAAETTRPVVMTLKAGSAGAIERFQLRVRANPAMLYRTVGHTLLACGRPAEAVTAFTKALEAGVSDPFVYNNRGLAYSLLNRLDLAIADYTEAGRLRPADATIRYNRGVALARRGDDFRALLDFDTAIRLKPDYIRAYEARSQIYLKQGDKARACADSTRAVDLARAARPEGQPPAPLPPLSHATNGSPPGAPEIGPSLRTR